MAFAATPVVAVLKSIWLVPRTRELTESLVGIKELLMVLAKWAKEFCEMEVKGKGEDEIEKSGRGTLECHRLYAAPPLVWFRYETRHSSRHVGNKRRCQWKTTKTTRRQNSLREKSNIPRYYGEAR